MAMEINYTTDPFRLGAGKSNLCGLLQRAVRVDASFLNEERKNVELILLLQPVPLVRCSPFS